MRIMAVLFSDEVPDPRDVVIICLADACSLFNQILSKRESERAAERISRCGSWISSAKLRRKRFATLK